MAELSKRDRMIDAAKTFNSNHGCGSIGRCEICMADFALQQTAHLEAENTRLRAWAKTVRNMEVYLGSAADKDAEFQSAYYSIKLEEAVRYAKAAIEE